MSMKIKKQSKYGGSKITSNTSVISQYEDAIEYIQSAIQSLGKPAKDGDQIARESIANLSVVLFDLK